MTTVIIPWCGAPNGEAIPNDIMHHLGDDWRHGGNEIHLVGMDVNPIAPNRWFYNEYYTCPFSEDPGYIDFVFDKFKDTYDPWILPLNGYDAFKLMSDDRTKESTLASHNPATILSVMDKAFVYKAHREYFRKSTADDLVMNTLVMMKKNDGHPVVVKNNSGRGSRGVFLVRNEFDDFEHYLHNKPGSMCFSIEQFTNLMYQTDVCWGDYVITPFYQGAEVFVNVLCNRGDVEWIQMIEITDKRDHVASRGHIIHDDELEKKVRDICKLHRFDYWINLQFIYDYEEKNPHLIEINPRISTFIGHTDYSVPYLAVEMAKGKDIKGLDPVPIGSTFDRIFKSYYGWEGRIR